MTDLKSLLVVAVTHTKQVIIGSIISAAMILASIFAIVHFEDGIALPW